jgi:hypothetical protein
MTAARRLNLIPTAPEVDEMDASGRTGRTAGGRTPDGRIPDGRTPDGWTLDALDTGRAGHWTAGPSDLDDGTAEGYHMVDADRRPTP